MATSYPTPAAPPLHPAAPVTPSIDPASTGSLTRALVAAMVVFFFATCAIGITAVMTRRYEEIFRDFGVALPLVTRVLIDVGRGLASPIGMAAAAAGVLLLCGIAAALASRRTLVLTIIIGLTLATFVIYLVTYFAAMQMPLISMIESLQQGGAVHILP